MVISKDETFVVKVGSEYRFVTGRPGCVRTLEGRAQIVESRFDASTKESICNFLEGGNFNSLHAFGTDGWIVGSIYPCTVER